MAVGANYFFDVVGVVNLSTKLSICYKVDSIFAFLTDLTRSACITTRACTRVAVDEVCARATILTGDGRTLVYICP